jgi:hypothetical protein
MNWLMKVLFPSAKGTIRISRDHLPGLTPPKAAPFKPKRSDTQTSLAVDLDGMYKRFEANGGVKAGKRTKKDRGVGF